MKLIKSLDQFGHAVHLSFNKNGHEYQTIYGGTCSLFIILFMIFYVYQLMIKLVWMLDDSNSTQYSSIDLEQLGPVNFNQTGVVPFFFMFDYKTVKPLSLKELEPYLEFKFINLKWDFTNG